MENNTDFSLPLDVEKIIPHRLPMRMIDTLEKIEGETAEAIVTLAEDQIFIDTFGGLDPVAFVEMIAQTYASWRGYEGRANGEPMRDGFMVAIRKFKHLEHAKVGEQLTIKVAKSGEFESFTIAEGEVYRQDTLLAQAQISLWIPDEIDGVVNISAGSEGDLS